MGVNRQDAKKIAKWTGQVHVPKEHIDILPILKEPKVWILVLNYFVGLGGFLAMSSFLPGFMIKYHQLDDKITLLVVSFYLIFASLVRSATGGVTDKYGGGECAIMGNFLIGFGSFILAFA